MRGVLCLALGVLVSAVFVASGGGAALSIANVAAESKTLSATVSWTTSAPARAVVQVGLDADLAIWSRQVAGRSGRVTLAGLEPSSTYRFRILARTAQGVGASAEGTFTTAPIAASSSASTAGGSLLVDRQPLFPRMVFAPCPYQLDAALAAGINLVMGSGCGKSATLLAALRGRAYSVIDADERGLERPGVIGWHLPDEADEHGQASSLPTLPHSSQSRRVSFLTLTNHFYSYASPLPQGRGIYPAFIAKAEMIGFDLYPLTIWCQRRFYDVMLAQRELLKLAKDKPTFQWIEAAPMSGCTKFVPTPESVELESWLAIEGGARGLGYFPSSWTPEIGKRIAAVGRTIAALSPALTAPERGVISTPQLVRASAHTYAGAIYVFASNSHYRLVAKNARISVPGLRDGWITAYGEGRRLRVRDGIFHDAFKPMQTHIYVAAPPGAPSQ